MAQVAVDSMTTLALNRGTMQNTSRLSTNKARIVVRIDKFRFRDLSLEQLELFAALLDRLERETAELMGRVK